MQDIGTLGGPESAAYAVNRDGSVIVGTSLTNSMSDSNACFVWTASTGMQNLVTVLDAAGVHTADNWAQLNSLVGISADGTGHGRLWPQPTYPSLSVWPMDSISGSSSYAVRVSLQRVSMSGV